jgi:hypothetical protein
MTRPSAELPERVFDKVNECQFFLVLMAESEKEPEKFMYFLSAFLSAFRSVCYRLFGVVGKQRGPAGKAALRSQLDSNARIAFLSGRRDTEVHSDGVKVWQRYNLQFSDSMNAAEPSRWTRVYERWSSRFKDGPRVMYLDWHFDGDNSNIIELCHDALNDLENIARQNVAP